MFYTSLRLRLYLPNGICDEINSSGTLGLDYQRPHQIALPIVLTGELISPCFLTHRLWSSVSELFRRRVFIGIQPMPRRALRDGKCGF